ncbi:zinc finger MYND domain-containing protein 10 homolog [Eupeodes corollae]|uniref:zinc finger MYND domain-containing protein 10 homolog n=1 Tax=Eupeodes corollae TaxID=290404 RepID=UPI0024915CFB|nr:zinc finger MYND domain-containing protein 10 homolog [Eupeodes corollae]
MSDVVFPEELVYFIESIRPYQLHEVGSSKWIDSHEMIIKLSQQAILELATHREESVKEYLVMHDKLKTLIHEAYCVLLWKTKVLPHLLDIDPNPEATFLIYTVFFHEGSVISLLEIALFHENGCESLKEASVDLVDYCAQAIAQIIGLVNMGYHEKESDVDVDESVLTEMDRQKRDMIFKIGFRCISILNYLADNFEVLPCSAKRRMVTTHDIPWLLADLLIFCPWYRKTSKGIQKFIEEKWTTVIGEDLRKVVKHEAQTWFCLRQILFSPSLMELYEMNEPRQKRLGQCQGLLHDTLLDQLPPLIELKHFLCTLSMGGDTQFSKKKSNLILEELPEIKENLIKEAKLNGGYLAIAQNQSETFLTNSKEKICSLAARLNSAYNTDLLADMEAKESPLAVEKKDQTNCGVCKKVAEKKCSKCKTIYYCSRQCQLDDWPNHKKQCITLETTSK